MTYKHLLVLAVAIGPAAMWPTAQQPAVVRDPEPRLVRPLTWQRPHITRTLSASRSELGLQGGKVAAELRTIEGQSCIVGSLVAFDVDDAYAFDIDEPVDVTVTYAAGVTTPFALAWERNGGEGYTVSSEIAPEPGSGLKRVTFRLDRARFSGQGVQSTDFAVGARNGTIALCDIEIARSNTTAAPAAFGRLRLEVKDTPSSKAMPARVGLYAANGRMPLPSEQAIAVHRYADLARMQWVNRRAVWPSDNRQFFYIAGAYDARVPAGVYDLVITRGPEYRVYRGKVEITADATTTSTIVLDRYADLPASGWYSGESHVHLPRQKTEDLDVWAQLAAEDVHVSNLLEMGNITTTYYRQPTWGRPGIFGRDGYFLVPGQEDPRTVMRGHTIHWNVGEHQHHEDAFFQYHTIFEKTRATGALTGYAHLGELFNGQRGLATDVPFGLVEFIEVLQGGRLNSEIWYRFLNLGYRVSPVGGADYPYFGPTLPGVERTYVKVDGALTPEAWYSGFRRGHVYVSNGPFLDFTVNGRMMGEELRVPRGSRLRIDASARLNPDVDVLDRLELVVLGDVNTQVAAKGQDKVALKSEIVADRSMWIAVRALGRHQEAQFNTIAHTAPIYVVVGDEPTWKREDVPSLVAYQDAQLNALLTTAVDPMGDLEAWETREKIVAEWTKQLPLLRPRVEEARRRYQELLSRVRATAPPATQ